MSFNINGGSVVTARVKLTGSTATTIFTAKARTTVLSVTATETGGATPNLTLEIYDVTNTTSYYLRKAVAMVAGTAVIFDEPFELPVGWAIRATSSASGGAVDVHVSYINPVAAAGR